MGRHILYTSITPAGKILLPSPPQPVRDGCFQEPDVHVLSVEVDMSTRSLRESLASDLASISLYSARSEQSRRLDPIPCALYLGSGRHDRPQISRNLLRLERDELACSLVQAPTHSQLLATSAAVSHNLLQSRVREGACNLPHSS